MLTVLYVLVLLSPILLLVVANMLREMPRGSRRQPDIVAAAPSVDGHRTRHQVFKGTRVALEAQFLLAPRMALQEAEEALRELAPERARLDLPRFATISDSRLQFEALMLAIESAERAAPVVHRSRH